MQTFGLARLYARRAGNDVTAGRTMDLMLNHVLYAGPILAGAGLLIHLRSMGAAATLSIGLAQSMGVPGKRAEDAPALAKAISEAIAEPGPHLIEAVL
jgi:hypothetical protein